MNLEGTSYRRVVEHISDEGDFDPGQAERMVWILDTLATMRKVPPENFELFLKGGTCVQNYLSPDIQRFSKDIELGLSTQEEFDAVESYVEELNHHLEKRDYDKYRGLLTDRPGSPEGDVICFDRFFDAEYAEDRRFDLHGRKGVWITVEFHTADVTPSFEESELSILPAQYGEVDVQFNCATRGKLLSDKIIAAMGPYYDAREEAKDILDLNAMLNDDEFGRRVPEAKDLIGKYAAETGSKCEEAVKRSVRTIRDLRDKMTSERLATQVNAVLPRDHRFEDLDAWRDFCDETTELLNRFFL